jgi:hypothetical protein
MSIVYNVKKDWDFVILVTGDRTVRTGKSVLAMTVSAFLVYCLRKMKVVADWNIDHIFFSSSKAVSEALHMKKHSVIMYDEGREALASNKLFTDTQKDLMDYFAECGQLNHIFIIVLPDFFNLIEEMAIARSEVLLNVYRKDVKIEKDLFNDGVMRKLVRFDRGQFEFFNRYQKQKLYDKAKAIRVKSYGLIKANFLGDFKEQYTVPEADYRAKKKEWLKRFKERKDSELKVRPTDVFRDHIIISLHNEGKSSMEIMQYLIKTYNYQIRDASIRRIVNKLTNKAKIDQYEEAELDVPLPVHSQRTKCPNEADGAEREERGKSDSLQDSELD